MVLCPGVCEARRRKGGFVLMNGMFGGSFGSNRLSLEEVFRRPFREIPLDHFTIHDPLSPSGNKMTVSMEENQYPVEGKERPNVAFLAMVSKGRSTFVLTDKDIALAEAFFAERWQHPEEHPTLVFLKDVGKAKIELVWKAEKIFAYDEAIFESQHRRIIDDVIGLLEVGVLRAASQDVSSTWTIHRWVQRVILAYLHRGTLKRDDTRARFAPSTILQPGACVEARASLSSSHIGIGAYVGADVSVGTWATIGTCAHIGRHAVICEGVRIGGVFDPLSASPTIIEEGAFIGSHSIVSDGVIVERNAVIAANVSLTSTTSIIDQRGSAFTILKGRVPARSIVIPGTFLQRSKFGDISIPCAYIVGTRNDSEHGDASLDAALHTLREMGFCT